MEVGVEDTWWPRQVKVASTHIVVTELSSALPVLLPLTALPLLPLLEDNHCDMSTSIVVCMEANVEDRDEPDDENNGCDAAAADDDDDDDDDDVIGNFTIVINMSINARS